MSLRSFFLWTRGWRQLERCSAQPKIPHTPRTQFVDTYDGALGLTYKCKYADGASEAFAWSHGQEEAFRLPTLFTPSGSYSAEASCDAESAGVALSGAGKLAAVQIGTAEEIEGAVPSHPLGRYRKRAGRRNAEAHLAK